MVSGAASGIGRQIALECTAEGARVVGLDISPDFLALGAEGTEGLVVDVSDESAVEGAVRHTVSRCGKIDGLVHSAYWTNPKPLLETQPEDFDRTYQVILKSAYLLARAVIPVMRENQGGVIVPIASVHSVLGFKNFFAYQVAKAGLLGFVRSIAVDYGPEVRAVG